MALPRMKMSVVEELNVLASLIYRARKIIQASEEKSVTNDHREKLLPIIRAIGFLNRELLALVKLPAGPAKVQRPC